MGLSPAGRKGVSPLIGAVLLIAFIMAIAGILTTWMTSFTEDQAGDIENRSGQMVQCTYAGMDITNATYFGENSLTEVTLKNTGTVDFNNVSVVSFVGASIQDKTYLSNLDAGEEETAELQDTGQEPDKVRATSKSCAEISVEESTISTR